MSAEDQRTAAVQHMTLSGQLMAAALAMLAIEGAFVAFASEGRETGAGFWIAAFAAFLAFVASIFVGGKGISKATKKGWDADWNLQHGKGCYSGQAICCLVGLMAFVALCVVAGRAKEPDDLEGARTVRAGLTEIVVGVGALEAALAKVAQAFDRIEARQGALEAELDQRRMSWDGVQGELQRLRESVAAVESGLAALRAAEKK